VVAMMVVVGWGPLRKALVGRVLELGDHRLGVEATTAGVSAACLMSPEIVSCDTDDSGATGA
jgi:hypothetical protein